MALQYAVGRHIMVNDFKPKLTAADVLYANGGMGPGFDALRLGLSIWVFTLHAMYVCPGVDVVIQFAGNPLHRILLTPVLPMFFLVSGYLVTGSAIRTKTFSTFLLFRIFRIVPALVVEITLSAFVLGPWLTEERLSEYFSDPVLYKYFFNVVGYVHFFLPGLFVKNPITLVNVNLWTLKPEFYCYIFMSAMILSGVVFNKRLYALVTAAVVVVTLVYEMFGGNLFNFIGFANWKILVVAFVLGSFAHHLNNWIVISKRIALAALLVAIASFMYPPAIVAGLLALVYIVVYIGTQRIYVPAFLKRGDCSYGIYLFGFPIQQTLVYFLPVEYRYGLIILALGLPLTLIFAMLSWNFVEKPTLRQKRKFKTVETASRLPLNSGFEQADAGVAVR